MHQIPSKYIGYLFPILVGVLLLHFVMLSKHVRQVGWLPLLACLVGTVTLLVARRFAADCHWVLNSGITLMLVGSVWNTFAVRRCAEVPSYKALTLPKLFPKKGDTDTH